MSTWCNNCESYRSSWYETCKGGCGNDCRNRCANCNKLFNSMVIRSNNSITTTEGQRVQLANEVANWTRDTGMAMEARIEVKKYPDGSSTSSFSMIGRPDIWRR